MALTHAVMFLRKHAHIPHIDLLPYRLTLVTLARFFHCYPEPMPRSLTLLTRWIWRGAIGSRYRGENSIIAGKVLRVFDRDQSQGVQHLLQSVDTTRPATPLPLSPFRSNASHCKLQLVALWALHPRHWDTGAPLTIAAVMSGETSAQLVKQPGKDDPPAARGLANRLLHPPYAGGLRKALLAQMDTEALQSYGVNKDALAALRSGDFGEFLRCREQTLSPHVNHYLDLHAQWEASDRPPLAPNGPVGRSW